MKLNTTSLAYVLYQSAKVIEGILAGKNLNTALRQIKIHESLLYTDLRQIREICYSSLRQYGKLQFIVQNLSKTKISNRTILALLYVATYRLITRSDIAYTVVSQAVDAAKFIHPKYAGLINAILRNYIRNKVEIEQNFSLEAIWQHPKWWINKLQKQYPDQWESILIEGNEHPPFCIRINLRKKTFSEIQTIFEQQEIKTIPLDDSALILTKALPVNELVGFEQGWMSIQDFGAQQATKLLNLEHGMKVLDACAAPGGKTSAILESCDVDLTALEMDIVRAEKIHENLHRLGLSAKVMVADASQKEPWWDGTLFDRILADVPCSASGVVRRNPDIKWQRTAQDIVQFSNKQKAILNNLWSMLKPNGQLLYVTCSVFKEENQQQISQFCQYHQDACLLPINNMPSWQILPTEYNDGFYYALLQKKNS